MLQYQYQVTSSGVQEEILGVIDAFVRLSLEKYRYPECFHGAHLRLIQQEMLALHDAVHICYIRPLL